PPRREVEPPSSAQSSLVWAAVIFFGFISTRVTASPRRASCQAASQPARPAPITVTFIAFPLFSRMTAILLVCGGYPPPRPGVHFWALKSEPKNRQTQWFWNPLFNRL